MELAIRRMIHYLSQKVFNAGDGKSEVKLIDAFGSWSKYRDVVLNQDKKKAFLEQMNAMEREAFVFCAELMRGSCVHHAIISTAVAEAFLVPAELIFQRSEWIKDDVFDLEELLQPQVDESIQAAMEEADAAEIAPPAPSEPKIPEKEPTSAAPKTITPDEVPVVQEDAPAPPVKERTRASYFKVIQIPQWMEDLLSKVSLASFEQALAHAQTCAAPSSVQSEAVALVQLLLLSSKNASCCSISRTKFIFASKP